MTVLAIELVPAPVAELQGALRVGGVRHVRRRLPDDVTEAAAALVRAGFVAFDGVLHEGVDVLAAARPHLTQRAAISLAREIDAAVTAFRVACGARKPKVFFGVVASDQCRKFHVDYVAMRLVLTLHGPGTEWVPDPGVDRDALARFIEDADTANRAIVPDPGAIRRCATGDWLLLEGEAWPGREGAGAVHRSPPIEATGLRRLVLTLTLPRSRRAPALG